MPSPIIPTSRPQHIIEWRLPLPAAVAGLSVAVIFVATIYFNGEAMAKEVQNLKNEVKDLRIEVKAGNQQALVYAGSLSLMQFRVEKVESDVSQLKGRR